MIEQARPRKVQYEQTENGLKPVYVNEVVRQPYEEYTPEDQTAWSTLMARQEQVLPNRACQPWLDARRRLQLSDKAIPSFEDLNAVLGPASGWQVVGVEGLLPNDTFFGLLSRRQFPVTWWIRDHQRLDYLPEPDLFHDTYGHVPLLLDPSYANYLQHFGHAGLRVAQDEQALQKISSLNWFTVEFGLMGSLDSPRIYGAGILSSASESVHALENPQVQRVVFDADKAMNQEYRIDQMQPLYFVVNDIDDMYRQVGPVLDAF